MRRPVRRAQSEIEASERKRRPKVPAGNEAVPPMERGSTVERVGRGEEELRKLWVVQLVRRGFTLERIVEQGPHRRPIPLDEQEVRKLYAHFLARTKDQFSSDAPYARALQIERLLTDLGNLRMGEPVLDREGHPVTYTDREGNLVERRKVNYAAVARLEHEYALVAGTHAPKQLRISEGSNVADELQRVLTGETREAFEERVSLQREVERDAEAGRHLRVVKKTG